MLIRINPYIMPLKSRLLLKDSEFNSIKIFITCTYLMFLFFTIIDIIIAPNNVTYNIGRIIVFSATILSSIFIIIKVGQFPEEIKNTSNSTLQETKWLGLDLLYLSIIAFLISIILKLVF